MTSKRFTKVSGDVHGRWDANKNSGIENDEFYGGLSTAWDGDRHGCLTEGEFTEAWDGLGPGRPAGSHQHARP